MSDSMKALEGLIRQTTVRNNVISSNIANVDTPNYRAKDVTFGQVLGSEIALVTTKPNHIAAGGVSGAATDMEERDTNPWADQNNVELDLEVAKMTQNAMLFEAGVTLLKKKIQMFKNALRT